MEITDGIGMGMGIKPCWTWEQELELEWTVRNGRECDWKRHSGPSL